MKPLQEQGDVQTEFCQKVFQPPPTLKQTDVLWKLFSSKINIFLKHGFDLENVYFDNYYGQITGTTYNKGSTNDANNHS